MFFQLSLGRGNLRICGALLVTQPGQVSAQRLLTTIEAGCLLIQLGDQPLLPVYPPGDFLRISLQVPPLSFRLDQGLLLLPQLHIERCHAGARLLFRGARLFYPDP